MFEPQGTTIHKLDSGGRIKLREQQQESLPRNVVLACGFDNCINIFGPDAWNLYCQRFAQLDSLDADVHDLKRLLIATAEICKIDDQGRLKVPEALLRWAGLDQDPAEAQLIRLEDRYEIWEAGNYREFLSQRGRELKQITRQLLRGVSGQVEEDSSGS